MSLNLLSMWAAVGVVAKLVLLAQMAMAVAIPVLALATLREGAPDHRQRGLLSIAASAPMLGLLGTAVGIIHACNAVHALGVLDPRLIAAGLAEALSMTALGLLIGVIALWVRTAVHARMVAAAASDSVKLIVKMEK